MRMPLRFDAAILSRMRSPETSRSNWANDRRTLSVKRPIDVVPDFVCETLSPSNARHDRLTKADLYARSKVGFYWLIDPVEATLEAYELDAAWLRLGGWTRGDVARVRPFELIEIDIARLFPPVG